MRQIVARIFALLVVTSFVMTGSAVASVSLSGVPSGIHFVGADCCQSESEEAQEPVQDSRLESTCCCRPSPFSDASLSAPLALGCDSPQRIAGLPAGQAQQLSPAKIRPTTVKLALLRARGPPGARGTLYSQHTSLLL